MCFVEIRLSKNVGRTYVIQSVEAMTSTHTSDDYLILIPLSRLTDMTGCLKVTSTLIGILLVCQMIYYSKSREKEEEEKLQATFPA